jgi:hypothetical protein
MPAIPYRFTSDGVKDVENGFRTIEARANAAERAAKSWSKSTVAANQQANRAMARQQGPARQTQERAQLKAEQDMAKAHAAAVTKNERAEIASLRRVEREREQAARRQARTNMVAIRQQAREEHAAERVKESHRKQLVGAAVGVGRFAVGAVGLAATGLAGIGGAALRNRLELGELASKVSVQSRGTGQTAVAPGTLEREWEAAAAGAPGVKASQVGGAVQQS